MMVTVDAAEEDNEASMRPRVCGNEAKGGDGEKGGTRYGGMTGAANAESDSDYPTAEPDYGAMNNDG